MNNIYTFIKSKEKPEPKKKVVYELTVDSENQPFIGISYVELDGNKITMESDTSMLDRISKDASYITRRTAVATGKIIPIVYNPETKYFSTEYNGENENNGDQFLLGYVVDSTVSKKMNFSQKVENLIGGLSRGIDVKNELEDLNKYAFEFVIGENTLINTDVKSADFHKEFSNALVTFVMEHDVELAKRKNR